MVIGILLVMIPFVLVIGKCTSDNAKVKKNEKIALGIYENISDTFLSLPN